MKEPRPLAVSIAAVICVVSSLVLGGLAVSAIAAPLPRPVVYAAFGAAALGLAGAYGAWQLRRWGAVLSVFILAVNTLLAAPGIPFGPNLGMHAFATATVVFDLTAITLLVLPASRRAYA